MLKGKQVFHCVLLVIVLFILMLYFLLAIQEDSMIQPFNHLQSDLNQFLQPYLNKLGQYVTKYINEFTNGFSLDN